MARALIAVATIALLGAVGGPAAAQSGGTVMVGYQSAAALRAALEHFPAREVRTVPALKTAELQVSRDVPRFARALRQQPGILYVHRPAARFSAAEPALAADSGGAYEWQYGATRANAVPPSVLAAASQVTIAVIDTGADLTAPDLAAKGATGYRVDTGSPDVEDTNGLYVVPGGVKLAITPAGIAPGPNDFKASAAFNATAGTFSGTIAAPTTSGSYTVTAISCFGDSSAPTCFTASAPLTV